MFHKKKEEEIDERPGFKRSVLKIFKEEKQDP